MDGDLISRKALLEAIDERERIARKYVPDIQDDELRPTLKSIREFVRNRPSVDAELVRHGRWEHGLKCPFCNQIDTTKPNYCPNCGAKMDEEDMKDGKTD